MRIFKLTIFYILSFTWGIIMTMFGLIGILFSLPFGKVRKFHGRLCAVWGKGWGGVSLGCFFFVSEDCFNDHTCSHECGHMLQNCLMGPFFIFLVAIPSFIRYHYRDYLVNSGKKKWYELPDYDDIWFEGQATRWGEKYILTDKF